MIYFKLNAFVIVVVASNVCFGQYFEHNQQQPQQPSSPHQQQQQPNNYYREPLSKVPVPQILSFQQAQNHDGNFKYLFTAENGLTQGESIAPDGTRTGGFEYVDPTGKKVSLKYQAGKDGFRVLEGDHIPRESLQAQSTPYQGEPGAQAQDHGNYQAQEDSYYGSLGSPASPTYQPQPNYNIPAPSLQSGPEAIADGSLEKDRQYFDEPGKPHSFGEGYAFQFGG